jgi:hypothetical protein
MLSTHEHCTPPGYGSGTPRVFSHTVPYFESTSTIWKDWTFPMETNLIIRVMHTFFSILF